MKLCCERLELAKAETRVLISCVKSRGESLCDREVKGCGKKYCLTGVIIGLAERKVRSRMSFFLSSRCEFPLFLARGFT